MLAAEDIVEAVDLSIAVGSDITAFNQPRAIIKTVHCATSHFDWIKFAPHCHGTHIEGPEHLSTGESTLSMVKQLPPLITAQVASEFSIAKALIVRTGWKMGTEWPVVSLEWLKSLPNGRILLIDTPSLDPELSEQLERHQVWFAKGGMVVEWCRIPPLVDSCCYWLALNVAAFNSDAIPCRPVLYKTLSL